MNKLRMFRIGEHDFPYAQQDQPLVDGTTHRGERTVEVPIGRWFVELAPAATIEVGAVLPYWGKVNHPVIDPYDPWDQCLRYDALEYDYTGRRVLCISTLEHIGRPEYGETRIDSHLAGQAFTKIANESSAFLVTIPLGYHLALDAHLRSVNWPRSMLRQVNANNEWRWQADPDWSAAYGHPLPFANGLLLIADSTTARDLWGAA